MNSAIYRTHFVCSQTCVLLIMLAMKPGCKVALDVVFPLIMHHFPKFCQRTTYVLYCKGHPHMTRCIWFDHESHQKLSVQGTNLNNDEDLVDVSDMYPSDVSLP